MAEEIIFNDEFIRYIVNNIEKVDGSFLEETEKYKMIIDFLDKNGLKTKSK